PIKIFRDCDLSCQLTPRTRYLDVLLPENHLPPIVRDFGRASLPLYLVERRGFRVAEDTLESQSVRRGLWSFPTKCRSAIHLALFAGTRSGESRFKLYHER